MNFVYPCKPMEISADSKQFQDISTDKSWVAEIKHNGHRCVVVKRDTDIVLWTRHGKRFKVQPEIIIEELLLQANGVYDGELTGTHRIKNSVTELILFDVMYCCDQWLDKLPYWQRRKLLDTASAGTEHVKVNHQVELGKAKLYNELKETYGHLKKEARPIEGIVCKDLTSKYVLSHTKKSKIINPNWVKVLI